MEISVGFSKGQVLGGERRESSEWDEGKMTCEVTR
jgi:hypothetical protein